MKNPRWEEDEEPEKKQHLLIGPDCAWTKISQLANLALLTQKKTKGRVASLTQAEKVGRKCRRARRQDPSEEE